MYLQYLFIAVILFIVGIVMLLTGRWLYREAVSELHPIAKSRLYGIGHLANICGAVAICFAIGFFSGHLK